MSIFKLAIWDFSGRVANYAVTFIVSVILTRLLTPAEYGVFGIVSSIISLAIIFVDSGFRLAIVQNKENTQQQLSTIFYINVGLALTMMALMFAASGFVERFYGIEYLSVYIAVTSINFLLSGLTVVPAALLQKEMRLKSIAFVNTVSPILCGAIAIPMALGGLSVWALISQPIAINALSFVAMTVMARWRPSLQFSPIAVKGMWQYGYRMFAASLLETIFNRIDVLMIGKFFRVETLGLFNRAKSLDVLVRDFSSRTTTSVVFPLFAKIQDDIDQTRDYYRRSLNFVCLISFFLIGGLFLGAHDLVVILFTKRWLPMTDYFRLLIIVGFAYPVSSLMVNLVSARGDSASVLRLAIVKKAVMAPTFLTLVWGGIFSFLIARAVASCVNLWINAIYVAREIGVSSKEQIASLLKYLLVCTFGVLVVLSFTYWIPNRYIHVFVVSTSFTIIYFGVCYLFGLEGLKELSSRIKPLLAREK